MNRGVLNLFYEEPEHDRWFPGDRFPRRLIRRIVRGRQKVSGQQRVFLNLCAGLDRLGVKYRVNDYRRMRRNPNEWACVVGKPFVLTKIPAANPIVFGSAVFSHPVDDPQLLERFPIRRILVPGEWMRVMWEPYFGDRVVSWPTGIDTDRWKPDPTVRPTVDVLVYDKVRWEHERYQRELIDPLLAELRRRNLTFNVLRYGSYQEAEYLAQLRQVRWMLFLCEHETQGFAYQEALSAGVPVLAWDRGGFWQDPTYYPARVKFAPVSSVPYWSERCGVRFANANEFPQRLDEFLGRQRAGEFAPRQYILEHLTLEHCARHYVELIESAPSAA